MHTSEACATGEHATSSEGAYAAQGVMDCLARLLEGQSRLEAQLQRIEGEMFGGWSSIGQETIGQEKIAASNPQKLNGKGSLSRATDGTMARSTSPSSTEGNTHQQVRRQASLHELLSLFDDAQTVQHKIDFMDKSHHDLLNKQEEKRNTLFYACNQAKGWQMDMPVDHPEYDPKADEEARRSGGLKAWLNEQFRTGRFDLAFGFAIFINAILMLFRLENKGQRAGYDFGFQHRFPFEWVEVEPPAFEVSDGTWLVFEIIFLIIFTAELVIRVAIRYRTFFRHGWNYLDLFLVGMAYMEVFLSLSADLAVLRMLRLVRLARVLRIARLMRSFQPLRILVATALQSMLSLVWSVLLIGLLLLCAACLVGAFTQDTIKDSSVDFEVRERLWIKFGTAGHAYYTLFRWTLTTSWHQDVDLLLLGVNEYLGFFVFPFIVVVNFALIRVVTGLFIKDTLQAAQKDAMTVLQDTIKNDNQRIVDLHAIFQEFDADFDGFVQKEEFDEAICDPRIKSCLRALQVDPQQAQSLFSLLDPGLGQLTPEELVAGAMDLREGASGKALDLATAKYENQKTMLVVRSIQQQCSLILKTMGYTMGNMDRADELHGTSHQKIAALHESLIEAGILKSSTEAGI